MLSFAVLAASQNDSTTLVIALITAPSTLLVAIATLVKAWSADRNARNADKAVNHRAQGTTVSQDVADMSVELRSMRRDILWLTQAMVNHVKSHNHDDDEERPA